MPGGCDFRARSVPFAAVLPMLLFSAGCGREVVLHAYDKAPIDALQVHRPVYKLADDGRVIELKLENKRLDTGALDQVAKLTALQTLSLYGSTVTDDGLRKLEELGELRALGLGVTNITDNGLEHLRNVRKLRWLWINGDNEITAAALEKLKATHPDLEVYR